MWLHLDKSHVKIDDYYGCAHYDVDSEIIYSAGLLSMAFKHTKIQKNTQGVVFNVCTAWPVSQDQKKKSHSYKTSPYMCCPFHFGVTSLSWRG